MSIKSIGETGLAYLWSKIKSAFVSTLGTSGDYLTWTKNGTTNNITIPYSETSLKLVPIATKTYTNVTAPANNDPNGFLFYAHMIPTSANLQAYVKFRVIGTMAGVSNLVGDLTSVVEYCTYQSTMLWYQIHNGINNTSYRNWYNHCVYRATTTGITNNYGHLLGLRFYSSYNPTSATYARTITIEILETQNCTITFENSMILYANAPGTGSTNYSGRTEYDGTSQGDKHTGDNNDVNYLNREYYGARITNSALYRYMICLTKLDGSLVPINSINNNITTTKTLTTDSFDPFGEIFYWGSTTTYTAGANVGDGSWWRQIMCDLRYSFNCGGYDTTSTLTARLPLYLVAVPQSDGSAKLHSSPLSQSLPSTEDGLIYIYLGRVYLDNYPYRVILSPKHPVYWYINGGVKLYSDAYNVILENEEVVSAALNDINSRIENIVVEETDPTVPDWAKLPYKPSYNYSEVGALTEYAYVDGAGFNGSTTINRYKVCSTSASTAAKTITITSGTFYLTTGAEVTVKFTYTNTASNPTLNVNNTGARSIYYNGTNIPASALSANRVYKFVYDGSYYLLVGTLGYTKTSELTNDAGFLTSSDVTDEVGEEDKPVTASAVYEYITEDERVIASALNDLNGRITTVETDIESDGMAIAAALGDLDLRISNIDITETDPVFTASAAHGISSSDITNWNGKADKIAEVNHGTSDTTFTLTPNVMHIWGTVTSLTLSLPTDSNSVLDEFMFTFTSGSTATTLSLPNTVKWVLELEVETNKTYLVSIINNLAGWLTNDMPIGSGSGGGGENNIIESISVNNTALTVDANKNVNITVPTKVSDLTNDSGFTSNAGTITGITMNSVSKGTSGVVDLGTVITSETSLSKGSTSGSGNAVTDLSVSGHTITLTKGKTFLESESDPVFVASAAYGISSSDITNWNGKTSNVGTVTGVKMNGTTNNPTNGVVDLGTVITSETSLSKGTTTGSGNAVTDISVSGHQITLTKGKTFLESETSLSKGSTSGSGNAVTDISVSGHTITLTKGTTFLTSSDTIHIYSGSSAPSSGTGSNGDIYIQTS